MLASSRQSVAYEGLQTSSNEPASDVCLTLLQSETALQGGSPQTGARLKRALSLFSPPLVSAAQLIVSGLACLVALY